MDHKKTRLLLIGAGIILVILFISVTVIRSLLRQQQQANTPAAPSSTPLPTQVVIRASQEEIIQEREDYTVAQEKIELTAAPTIKALERSTNLKDALPYRGTDFSILYDDQRYMYVIRYFEGRETAGEQELTSFLKENEITSIDALDNYRIIIETN